MSQNKIKTTEQMELEQIKHLQLGSAKQIKLTQDYRQVALSSKGYKPVHTVKCTRAEEFNFATDKRIKNTEKNKTQNESNDFIHSLRNNAGSNKQVCYHVVVKTHIVCIVEYKICLKYFLRSKTFASEFQNMRKYYIGEQIFQEVLERLS